MEEMERFMLEYGEQVVDLLGEEVDRIELKIKVRRARECLASLCYGFYENVPKFAETTVKKRQKVSKLYSKPAIIAFDCDQSLKKGLHSLPNERNEHQ